MLDARAFTTGDVLHVAGELPYQLLVLFYMVEKRFVGVLPDVVGGLRFRICSAVPLCRFDGVRGHHGGC